jgi:hypothetical protein
VHWHPPPEASAAAAQVMTAAAAAGCGNSRNAASVQSSCGAMKAVYGAGQRRMRIHK